MAQNTAQYEALRYTSQAPVFDFGQITKGVNEVVEKKRAEDERKAKELEAQKLQLLKDYGDEIYSDFELTGLDDIDRLGMSTKNLILDMAEDTNRKLANGEISMVEASKRMMMAKNESKNVSEYIGQMNQYAEAIRAKGADASPSDALKLSRIDSMYANGVSVGRDSSNRMVFISNENGKKVASPFAKLKKLQTFSSNPKPDGIIEAVMKNSKANVYTDYNGKQTITPLTKDLKLTENQRAGFKSGVDVLDGPDLYDLAVNVGLEPEYNFNGEVELKDPEKVKKDIVSKMEELALNKYGDAQISEAKVNETGMARERIDIQKAGLEKSTPKPPSFTETETQKIYPVDISKQKKIQSITLGGNQYNNVIITGYAEAKNGGADTVTISYDNSSKGEFSQIEDGAGVKTETIKISKPEDLVLVREAVNLGTTAENLKKVSAEGDTIFGDAVKK